MIFQFTLTRKPTISDNITEYLSLINDHYDMCATVRPQSDEELY